MAKKNNDTGKDEQGHVVPPFSDEIMAKIQTYIVLIGSGDFRNAQSAFNELQSLGVYFPEDRDLLITFFMDCIG